MRALVYADYALKFLQTRDSTTKEEREYNQAIRTLKALAEKYDLRPGVGIAAIQIGIPKRMCAIYIPSVDEEGNIVKCDQWALVNPRIVANAVKVAYLKNGEGCLSVPEDQPGIVPRSAKVTVKGYDALTDQEVTIVARGFTAICLQHELDHFEGILYYDHFNKEDPKAPIPNAMVIE